jgi:hypothetical protein
LAEVGGAERRMREVTVRVKTGWDQNGFISAIWKDGFIVTDNQDKDIFKGNL